jgi:hypothetical protein
MTGTRQTLQGGRHRAGAAAPPQAGRPFRQSRMGRAMLASGMAVATAAGGVLIAQTADAAPPTAPNNLLVFPDRDFVSIEGYIGHKGDLATVTVTRGTTVVGQSSGKVSGDDVAFEINHPGGVCWGVGAGAGLNVTPDIKAGDKVSIKFPDNTSDDTIVSGGVASNATQSGTKVTVTGKLDPSFDPAFVEQRIINPALVDLIGKRDVRALPGPLAAAPKGGYTSGMEIAADGSYTATYVFDTQAAADAAANADLGERLMSWQAQDPAGNRQGLTIAEFGEAGGAGMGNCPAGPGASTPQAGSVTVVPSTDGTSAKLDWTPAVAAAGASPVAGYSVLALAPAAVGAVNGQQAVTGYRFDANATSATMSNPNKEKYTYEVRAVTVDGKTSAPFTVGTANPGGGTQTPTQAPALSLEPAPAADGSAVAASSVKATTTAGTQIWYAVDTPAFAGGVLADAAKPYTGPIPVTAATTLHFAALNADNNIESVTGKYTPAAATALTVPTGVSATGGQTTATVAWVAPAGATGAEIAITNPDGVASTQTATTSPQTIPTPVKGTYTFTVTATNVNGRSDASAPVTAVATGVVDTLTVTRAQWKSGDFRVVGASTALSGTITVRTGPGSSAPAIPSMSGPLTPPVAPATGGTFDIRTTKAAAPAANPGRIWITSSNGGQIGPVTVTG